MNALKGVVIASEGKSKGTNVYPLFMPAVPKLCAAGYFKISRDTQNCSY